MADIEKILVGKETYETQTNLIKTAIESMPVNQPTQYVQYAEATSNQIIFHNHGNANTTFTIEGLPAVPTGGEVYLHANSSSVLEWSAGSGGIVVVANPTIVGGETVLNSITIGSTNYVTPKVSASATGTSTDIINYLTINGVEKKIGGKPQHTVSLTVNHCTSSAGVSFSGDVGNLVSTTLTGDLGYELPDTFEFPEGFIGTYTKATGVLQFRIPAFDGSLSISASFYGLCFENVSSSAMDLGITMVGAPSSSARTRNIYYSLDGGETFNFWSDLTTEPAALSIPANSKVMLWTKDKNLFSGDDVQYTFTATQDFKASGSLISLWNFDATVSYRRCDSLFKNNTHLIDITNLKGAPNCEKNSYQSCFEGCTGITSVPSGLFPATNTAESCYKCCFKGCTGLTSIPTDFIKATEMTYNCYNGCFNGCSNLKNCCDFSHITSYAGYCFANMFSNCVEMENNIPTELPNGTLFNWCFREMFYNCQKITTAPNLPMTVATPFCFSGMFIGCSSITTAPSIALTTLADNCCSSMFSWCTALTTAPTNLPATDGVSDCYKQMFYNCNHLTTAPNIALTSLADNACKSMFYGCSALNVTESTGTTAFFTCPDTAGLTNPVQYMFYPNSGTAPHTPTSGNTYYYN